MSSPFFFLYFRKNSNLLGENYLKGIPIEVIPMAWTPVKNKIEKKLGGQAILRMALRKAVSIKKN